MISEAEKPIPKTARFHLPGLFEFYDFYRVFLPLYAAHREYFYEWISIGSLYGAPADCLWSGGRFGHGNTDAEELLDFLQPYGISARLTFSNSMLRAEHLADRKCNRLCAAFEKHGGTENGVIVHSELLTDYLRRNYPGLYLVSSTTKVLTDFPDFAAEVRRDAFRYVVPDFRLNRQLQKLNTLSDAEKSKVEFLCNECCSIRCKDRKTCYETVSRKMLGESGPDFQCTAPDAASGYRFSKAMENPAFIGPVDIRDVYLPNGFSEFKIEGRNLGTAMVLEILLCYMVKPAFQIHVREQMYLDSTLDLF